MHKNECLKELYYDLITNHQLNLYENFKKSTGISIISFYDWVNDLLVNHQIDLFQKNMFEFLLMIYRNKIPQDVYVHYHNNEISFINKDDFESLFANELIHSQYQKMSENEKKLFDDINEQLINDDAKEKEYQSLIKRWLHHFLLNSNEYFHDLNQDNFKNTFSSLINVINYDVMLQFILKSKQLHYKLNSDSYFLINKNKVYLDNQINSQEIIKWLTQTYEYIKTTNKDLFSNLNFSFVFDILHDKYK